MVAFRSCVQINVTGGGSNNPGGVSFPGAYKGSDPGITVSFPVPQPLLSLVLTSPKINIYYPPLTSYTIPGGSTVVS